MLIDSENLIARIDKCFQESAKTGLGLEPVMAIRDVKALISVMPEVNAAPVKPGRWIYPKEESTISGKCSCCGWEAHYYEDDVAGMPYCPNCGARMDLEEQQDD